MNENGFLINTRWINIPEEAIYKQLVNLGITSWELKTFFSRHYLRGGAYAYPYSLPINTIVRLAKRLNETELNLPRTKTAIISINKEWLNNLEIDKDGCVRIEVGYDNRN